MTATIGISPEGLGARREKLLDDVRSQGLTGCVLRRAPHPLLHGLRVSRDGVEHSRRFRHSDTVVVTPEGIDVLTENPKKIESLTIPV